MAFMNFVMQFASQSCFLAAFRPDGGPMLAIGAFFTTALFYLAFLPPHAVRTSDPLLSVRARTVFAVLGVVAFMWVIAAASVDHERYCEQNPELFRAGLWGVWLAILAIMLGAGAGFIIKGFLYLIAALWRGEDYQQTSQVQDVTSDQVTKKPKAKKYGSKKVPKKQNGQ